MFFPYLRAELYVNIHVASCAFALDHLICLLKTSQTVQRRKPRCQLAQVKGAEPEIAQYIRAAVAVAAMISQESTPDRFHVKRNFIMPMNLATQSGAKNQQNAARIISSTMITRD